VVLALIVFIGGSLVLYLYYARAGGVMSRAEHRKRESHEGKK
jgi:hypothetical protein